MSGRSSGVKIRLKYTGRATLKRHQSVIVMMVEQVGYDTHEALDRFEQKRYNSLQIS